VGGAERQIIVLAKGLYKLGHTVNVVVFYGGGEMESELRVAGVPLVDLHKTGRWDLIGFIWRLYVAVREIGPSTIYSFMGPPNILTIVLKLFFSKINMVWGVRSSKLGVVKEEWLVRFSRLIEGYLSRFATLVICNSNAGYDYVVSEGYPQHKVTVIANGFDTNYFTPNESLRRSIRLELGVGDEDVLIGIAARLDPMKDYSNFLKAAAELAENVKNIRFVSVGDGPFDYAEELRKQAAELGLTSKLSWLGNREDMPGVYNAMDIIASSSCSEGFSNTIAEAMACGVPCVATDVGDSKLLVGGTGIVVPPRNSALLCDGIHELIGLLSLEKKSEVRMLIEKEYSEDKMVSNTVNTLGGLISQNFKVG